MTQRIDITPNPPVGGQSATICYDFSGLSISSVNLEIIWTPSSLGSMNCGPLTPDQNCCTIDVPARATSYLIRDLSGYSEDRGGIVDS